MRTQRVPKRLHFLKPQVKHLRLDKATIEFCLGVTAVALGMVMAGTGDLTSLQMLRELRWLVDEGITYGTSYG